MFEDIQSFFATPPKRPTSQLGAGMSDQDEPAIPAFQKAWKDGALFDDLFGPAPFTLHGTVGRSGADNHRPDVAKVETFLGDAGYYKPLTNDGPSGWHSTNLDTAIRSFQKDKGLAVDGFLKPGGPTISKIGSLLGGSQPAIEPEAKPDKSDPWEIKIGGRDPGDPNKLKPPKEWEIIGNGEADDEDEYLWLKAPQPVGEPVSLVARAEVPSGAMPRMPRPDTPEEQATYQQEYQQWLKDNWPKIQQNQVLVAQGYPPIDIPNPPRRPGETPPDPMYDLPRPGPGAQKPAPVPQPRPAPQPEPGPEIVFGPQGGPTIRLPGTTGPANPFPMPQSPDIWKILAGRVPKPKDLFDSHTISEDGAREHDAYAASLVRDSNPDETARYLKNVINWSGDQGRGDVADLLGRFAKVDEAKAKTKTLQDALHRSSGERIPFRIAPLGEGLKEAPADQEITLPKDNPWGSAAHADRWEAGNMAKALMGKSDYKDAVTHFAGEFKRDPTAARAYTAAVYEDMAATSPKQAVQFASAMGKAGLAEEAKTPEGQPEQKPEAQPEQGPKGPAPTPDSAPVPTPNPPASQPVPPAQPPKQQPEGGQKQGGNTGSDRPMVNKGDERIKVILEDKPAKFEIKDNVKEDGSAPLWRIDSKGKEAVEKYGKIAEEEAKRQGVDPNLIKAVMYYENADGHKFGLNDAADKLGVSGSVMPMNINPKIWGGLGVDRASASQPEKNIQAAVTLIKRIQDRVDDPTPEKIGSLWNGIMLDQVNQRGARIGRIAKERPWEK